MERRGQVIHVIDRVNGQPEELDVNDGRRQPSLGDTSRINREVYVRICERLGVKFPGPTRPRVGFPRATYPYIDTLKGWLYLAVIIDLRSRRVVGWSMSQSLEERLALDALRMALLRRKPGRGVLHHSDRGSQYAGKAFRNMLRDHGMHCSMSRKGDCWDNAVVESFNATIKTELIHRTKWMTREEARAAIYAYIETWHNCKRLHSTLGYLSPIEFEEQEVGRAS